MGLSFKYPAPIIESSPLPEYGLFFFFASATEVLSTTKKLMRLSDDDVTFYFKENHCTNFLLNASTFWETPIAVRFFLLSDCYI